ncbi:MAG: phage baseplate assembly protein V [Rhodospirillaceae bacterium]|nr:phage baseplate assembly protein V [Rhodospirillaceae bacterium]
MDSEAYREVLLRLSALERRVNALFRVGKAAEVTLDPYRVRVDIGPGEGGGPVLTDPLPVFVLAAGVVREWTPMTEGEGCAVLSPGGEDFSAFVLRGLYNTDFVPPDSEAARHVIAVGDGGTRLTMTEDAVTIASPTTITLRAANDTHVVR